MRYYVGYKGKGHALIFRSKVEPTVENHPKDILFCWGGYKTRSIADAVAMYQNYHIDNESRSFAPCWGAGL